MSLDGDVGHDMDYQRRTRGYSCRVSRCLGPLNNETKLNQPQLPLNRSPFAMPRSSETYSSYMAARERDGLSLTGPRVAKLMKSSFGHAVPLIVHCAPGSLPWQASVRHHLGYRPSPASSLRRKQLYSGLERNRHIKHCPEWLQIIAYRTG